MIKRVNWKPGWNVGTMTFPLFYRNKAPVTMASRIPRRQGYYRNKAPVTLASRIHINDR